MENVSFHLKNREICVLSHISGFFKQKLTFFISNTVQILLLKNDGEKELISPQNRFLDVDTTFRHTFPSSDLQCLPPGDPTVLCA